MEKPFDDLHVGIESQLLNIPEHIPDSTTVSAARKEIDTVDGLVALGQALSRQLRYRQAILAYTRALEIEPDNRAVLRLRAGRYLTTLQSDLALRDFERCLALGGDNWTAATVWGLHITMRDAIPRRRRHLRLVSLCVMMKWALQSSTGTHSALAEQASGQAC